MPCTKLLIYSYSLLGSPVERVRVVYPETLSINLIDFPFQRVAENILCLPGRIAWCSADNVHGIALGPMHLFNGTEHTTWLDHDSEFIPLYGRTFHLFYTSPEFVYYAGLYKAVDIRTQCPEGISAEHLDHIVSGFPMLKTKKYSLTGSRQIWQALAGALTSGSKMPVHKSLKNTLATLYRRGALRVEPLGLQCLKFDLDVYTTLRNRFSVFQSAMTSVGKREANFAEASMPSNLPKSKRKKIH